MGVAAAYLGELVTDELKAMAAEDLSQEESGGKGGKGPGAGGGGRGGGVGEGPAAPTRIVVVAPQEGQVRKYMKLCITIKKKRLLCRKRDRLWKYICLYVFVCEKVKAINYELKLSLLRRKKEGWVSVRVRSQE